MQKVLILTFFLSLTTLAIQIKQKEKNIKIKTLKNISDESDCLPSNIHITLGDYFSDSKSEIIYRVGFMQKNQNCQNEIKLKIEFEDEKLNPKVFQPKKTRDYNFSGPAYHQTVEYHRSFKFFEITNLENNSKFKYSILSNDVVIKGPFNFETKILDKEETNFNFKSFGDHDLVDEGKLIIDYLEETYYDILILLGDYSYDIENDNGEHGDKYFDYLEKILTKAPVIIVPGNHEALDNSRFLNSRFIFPGTKIVDDNNNFFFIIKDTLFLNFNLDYYQSNINEQINMMNKLQEYFDIGEKLKINHKILISHRPLLCSSYQKEVAGLECQLSIYYNKEINDLILNNELDLIVSGHVHNYERLDRMDNYTPNAGYTQIIAGTGGNSHWFENFEKYDINFLESQVQKIPGFLSLDCNKRLRGQFIEAGTGEILDDFVINQIHITGNGFSLFFKITGYLILVFIICFLIYYIYGMVKGNGDDEVQSFIESEKLEENFLADGFVTEDVEKKEIIKNEENDNLEVDDDNVIKEEKL